MTVYTLVAEQLAHLTVLTTGCQHCQVCYIRFVALGIPMILGVKVVITYHDITLVGLIALTIKTALVYLILYMTQLLMSQPDTT